MKLQTVARISKVKEELVLGSSRPYIMEKFSKEFRLAPTTIGYFITMARKELQQEIRERKELIGRIRRDQIDAMAENIVAQGVEAEAVLTQILRGEIMEEKIVYTEKGPEIMRVAPGVRDMMEVIRMVFHNDNRCGRTKSPPKLEPLAVFYSDLPLWETPIGDGAADITDDEVQQKENKSAPLQKTNGVEVRQNEELTRTT